MESPPSLEVQTLVNHPHNAVCANHFSVPKQLQGQSTSYRKSACCRRERCRAVVHPLVRSTIVCSAQYADRTFVPVLLCVHTSMYPSLVSATRRRYGSVWVMLATSGLITSVRSSESETSRCRKNREEPNHDSSAPPPAIPVATSVAVVTRGGPCMQPTFCPPVVQEVSVDGVDGSPR